MIHTICSKCGDKDKHPDVSEGRIAKCLKCGQKNIVPPAGTLEWGSEGKLIADDAVEPVGKVAVKSIMIIGALVAFCAVFFFGAAAIIQSRKEPPPPPKTQHQIDAEKKDKAKSEVEAREQAKAAVNLITVLLLFASIVAWFCAVYCTGAWIARDAYYRGLNGLSWACFYFAFQFLNRVALGGAITLMRTVLAKALLASSDKGGMVETVIQSPLWLVMIATEALHWGGLFVYLYCRQDATSRAKLN